MSKTRIICRRINFGALFTVILGITIVILASVNLKKMNEAMDYLRTTSGSFSKSSQYQSSYSFGADFYTEMFGVTYKALSELNDISTDIAANFSRLNNSLNAEIGLAVESLHYLIFAVGIAMVGFGCTHLVSVLSVDVAKPKKEQSENG